MTLEKKTTGQLQVVYAGISGVMHPRASKFELIRGYTPWQLGHFEYESVPLLVQALKPYPDAKIVLTSTQPNVHGMPYILECIGPALASRVIGWTFEDLTKKNRRGQRQARFSTDDYSRMNKSEIVRTHVKWLQPAAWVAIDDENILWTDSEHVHLVETDGCKGLRDQSKFEELQAVLATNFQAIP